MINESKSATERSTPFGELENRIHNVRNRIEGISQDICIISDSLNGSEPSPDGPVKTETDTPSTILSRLGIAMTLLENATEELSHQRGRLNEHF